MCRVFILAVAFVAVTTATDTSITAGHVVQFFVYAETQTDVSKVFPGAYVDYTWNNVFVVSVWVDNPDTAIPLIRKTIDANPMLRIVVPPYTMTAATQKWLHYNLVWIGLLSLLFCGGCVCGMAVMNSCYAYKSEFRAISQHRRCHTRF
jgi:hypothetical protein